MKTEALVSLKPLSARTIRSEMSGLNSRLEASAERHRRVVIDVENQNTKLRARCSHNWKRLPDAAGGPADYVCENCGAYR